MRKRVIGLFLSVCMLAALLPAGIFGVFAIYYTAKDSQGQDITIKLTEQE